MPLQPASTRSGPGHQARVKGRETDYGGYGVEIIGVSFAQWFLLGLATGAAGTSERGDLCRKRSG